MAEKNQYVIEKRDLLNPYRDGSILSRVELTDEEYKLYQKKCFYLSIDNLIHYNIDPLNENNTEEFEKLIIPDKVCIYYSSRLWMDDLHKLEDNVYCKTFHVLKNISKVKGCINDVAFKSRYFNPTNFKFEEDVTDELMKSNKILWLVNNYNNANYPDMYLNLFLFGVPFDINEEPDDFFKRIRNTIKSKIKYVLENYEITREDNECLLID